MHKEKIDFIKKNDTMNFTPLLLLPIRNILPPPPPPYPAPPPPPPPPPHSQYPPPPRLPVPPNRLPIYTKQIISFLHG